MPLFPVIFEVTEQALVDGVDLGVDLINLAVDAMQQF